jgi:uncharacterized membrane protein HdeD (DUF308 family)
MSFLKKYNGTTNVRLLRLERSVWTLIYGGLLSVVLGLFIDQSGAQDASLFYQIGGLAVGAGVVLIYVRSLLHEDKK